MYWVRYSPILIPYQAWNQLRSRLSALSTNGWKPDIATRYCNTEGTLQRRNLAWSGIKPRAIWTPRQVLWGFLIPAPGIFVPLLLTLYLHRAGVLPTGYCIHLYIPIIV